MAARAVPQLASLPPATFGRGLSTGELALGAALLTPFVSPLLAGAALTAFSAGLLRAWWLTPGTHEEGSPRPTQSGTAVAKDVWMLGIGLGLVLDGLSDRARARVERTGRSAGRTGRGVSSGLPVS
jgi:hypothetical protein